MNMKPQKFKPIKTERLSLRPLTPSFKLATELYNLIDRNREHFRWIPLVNIKSPEEEYNWLLSVPQKWKDSKEAHYGIYLHGTNKLIGLVGVPALSWAHERAEIGYWLDAQYTGNGYVTEAAAAVQDMLFTLGINRIYIRANIKNKASWSVAKRLGFIKEGIHRQELWNAYTNEYEDIVCYAKLRSEWKTPRKK